MTTGLISTLFPNAVNPAIIPGVTIQASETIVAGDQVALDYQGKALKVGAPANLTVLGPIASLIFHGYVEVSLDKYVIFASSASATYFIFYNKATNTVTASPTTTNIFAGQGLIDVRVLGSGEIVILWNSSVASSQYVAKYTAAGVLVGAVLAVATQATYHASGIYNFIAPSPVNGEFFVGTYEVTTFNFVARHYNTSVVYQGSTAALVGSSGGAIGTMPHHTAVGSTCICCVVNNQGSVNPFYYVFNATTRAVVGTPASISSFDRSSGLAYDATNAQFVYFGGASTTITAFKITQAGAVATQIATQNTGTSNHFLLSQTAAYAGGWILEYSTAGGGTVTARRAIASDANSVLNLANAIAAPNYGFKWAAQNGGAGNLLSYVYVQEANTAGSGNQAYTVNQSTGVLTPLFSYQALGGSPLNPTPVARQGARYDIYVYVEIVQGTTNSSVIVRRFDAGILYGACKKNNGTTIDIDTSQVGGTLADTTLTPGRSRSVVHANGIDYFIGG